MPPRPLQVPRTPRFLLAAPFPLSRVHVDGNCQPRAILSGDPAEGTDPWPESLGALRGMAGGSSGKGGATDAVMSPQIPILKSQPPHDGTGDGARGG